MAEPTIKIEHASYVITLDPERRIIADGSLLIKGRHLVKVGKASELRDVMADRIIDAHDKVVTPGLTNGHLHISYAHATRGIFPDDLGPDYLPNVFKLQSEMTEEEEYYTSLLAITESVKYGTTSILDPGSTKYLDACMQAYRESGCRIIIGQQVTDRANPLNIPVWTTEDAKSSMERVICSYDHLLNDRVRAWAMPFSANYASDNLLLAAKGLADRYGTGLTIHHINTPTTVKRSIEENGLRPIEHLEKIGVLGPNVLLSHALGLNESEIASLARSETKIVVCPTAAMKSGAGTTLIGKLPEMLAAGVTVCLGTDAGNNSNLIETLRSMYLVAVIYKDSNQTTSMVPSETALEMATINGASALGLGSEIGSLEPGKKADIVLFDTRTPQWRALLNPVNTLVYNVDGRSVDTVIVDGRILVEGKKTVFVDEWRLIDKVQELGEDLLHRTGVGFRQNWPIV